MARGTDLTDRHFSLTAATVAGADGMARLQEEWQRLADVCPTATVFQTWEWNAAWWRHYGRRPGRSLHLLTLRDGDGRLVGLAPLMTGFWYATPLRRLSFVGTGASDYLDVLAAPEWEEAVATAFYAALRPGVADRGPPAAPTGRPAPLPAARRRQRIGSAGRAG